MKSVKEIKKEANEIYSRSSHYIVGTFLVTLIITGMVGNVLDAFGIAYHRPYLGFLTILLAPMSVGMVKASLLAYDHKASKVKTKSFTLEGISHYGQYAMPFVGKELVLKGIMVFLVSLVFFIFGLSDGFGSALTAVLTGRINDIGSFGMVGALLATVFVLVLNVIVGGYLAFAEYLVVERGASLKESLVGSFQMMQGNLWSYFKLRLSYFPYMLLTVIVVNVFSISFNTMFNQLLTLTPQVPAMVYTVILNMVLAVISSFVGVMIYQVKERLAVMVMYKELSKD